MLEHRMFSSSEKAASGMMDGVIDIDALDVNNELAAVEYVEDIYRFYEAEEEEEEGRIVDYMASQPDINANMRSILIDWLIDIHHGYYKLMPETLYLTVNLIDRYLSFQVIPREEFTLLGLSALLIASKYEENRALEVSELVWISDYSYCREQILAMEKSILEQLEWCITVPTPYVFLARYVKASVPCDMEMDRLVFYLAELGLMHYPLLVLNRPSMLAASAVYAARKTLKKTPCWTETLKYHTGYLEHDVMEHAEMLLRLRDWAPLSALRALSTKYRVSGNAQGSLLCSLSDLPVSCS